MKLTTKTGQRAEDNLLDMVKNNKWRHRYVSTTLTEFSTVMNQICNKFRGNDRMIKYLTRIHFEDSKKRIRESQLVGDELTHLDSALHTRWLEKLRKENIKLSGKKTYKELNNADD